MSQNPIDFVGRISQAYEAVTSGVSKAGEWLGRQVKEITRGSSSKPNEIEAAKTNSVVLQNRPLSLEGMRSREQSIYVEMPPPPPKPAHVSTPSTGSVQPPPESVQPAQSEQAPVSTPQVPVRPRDPTIFEKMPSLPQESQITAETERQDTVSIQSAQLLQDKIIELQTTINIGNEIKDKINIAKEEFMKTGKMPDWMGSLTSTIAQFGGDGTSRNITEAKLNTTINGIQKTIDSNQAKLDNLLRELKDSNNQ